MPDDGRTVRSDWVGDMQKSEKIICRQMCVCVYVCVSVYVCVRGGG